MRRAVAGAMIALALGAIGGGFWIVGSPWEARAQIMDRERIADLQRIARELRCEEGLAPEAVPEDGDVYCDGTFEMGDWVDPVTEAPYRYERIDDVRFRLCAEFHDTAFLVANSSTAQGSSFDADTGCLTRSVRR